MTDSYAIYTKNPSGLAKLLRDKGVAVMYVGRSHVYARTTVLEETQLLSIIASAGAYTVHSLTRRAK